MLNHPRATVQEYWDAALGDKEKLVEIDAKDVDKAKAKIIEILMEEQVVPSYKALMRLVDMDHLVFDLALKELKKDDKVKFNSRSYEEWWSKGYRVSGENEEILKKKLGELSKDKLEEEYKKNSEIFLKALKEKGRVKKQQLWEIGKAAGIKPVWKISYMINRLKKEKKIVYTRTKPVGWIVA